MHTYNHPSAYDALTHIYTFISSFQSSSGQSPALVDLVAGLTPLSPLLLLQPPPRPGPVGRGRRELTAQSRQSWGRKWRGPFLQEVWMAWMLWMFL